MNGIGEQTTVEITEYFMIPLFRWLSVSFALISVFFGYKWYRKSRKWKEMQAQTNGGERR
jgi:hypothetical protein